MRTAPFPREIRTTGISAPTDVGPPTATTDRVTTVTDPAGFETQYLYDVDGFLIGVVDRNGNPTLYEVDAAGQVLTETDASAAVTSFEGDGVREGDGREGGGQPQQDHHAQRWGHR